MHVYLRAERMVKHLEVYEVTVILNDSDMSMINHRTDSQQKALEYMAGFNAAVRLFGPLTDTVSIDVD